MNVWYWPYTLHPITELNALDRGVQRDGFLLRIEFSPQQIGYADCHPWEEFGDLPVFAQLESLRNRQPTALVSRSVHFAHWDAQVRARKESLFYSEKGRSVPLNHYLLPKLDGWRDLGLLEVARRGFESIKIKVGMDLAKESDQLWGLTAFIEEQNLNLQLRLDFNASIGFQDICHWFESCPWLHKHIEFIEDPCAYKPDNWNFLRTRFNLKLALDRAADPLELEQAAFDVVVIKPAVQDETLIIEKFSGTKIKFVFTHYMDHPVGQMFALATAERAMPVIKNQMLACGLQATNIYQDNEFSKLIHSDGAFVIPPVGTGVGFDDPLAQVEWRSL